MKEIRFKISQDQFNNAMNIANEFSFKSVSLYAKYLVCLTSNKENKIKKSFEENGEVTKQKVTIYLEPEQIECLDNNAKNHGYSRSQEAVFRIKSTLSKEPNLYLDEIKNLDLSRIAVNKIGRNISYLIKDKGIVISDNDLKDMIQELQLNINKMNSLVLKIIEKSKNRF